MAKWRIKSGNVAETSERESPAPSRTGQQAGRHRPDADPAADGIRRIRSAVTRVTGALATVVTIVATFACVLLALHIAFAVFTANPDNPIVRTVNDWSGWFAWRLRDMFAPRNPRVAVLVNYSIAAVVYLVAGRIVAGLLRRIR